jgi:hypothetical protein
LRKLPSLGQQLSCLHVWQTEVPPEVSQRCAATCDHHHHHHHLHHYTARSHPQPVCQGMQHMQHTIHAVQQRTTSAQHQSVSAHQACCLSVTRNAVPSSSCRQECVLYQVPLIHINRPQVAAALALGVAGPTAAPRLQGVPPGQQLPRCRPWGFISSSREQVG